MKPKDQGKCGERACAAWLYQIGAGVFFPFPEHPDIDLIAVVHYRPIRIQVKTTTVFRDGRWVLTICTRGGNRSWNGLVKLLDETRCDYLFALAGDGRQWFIPATELGGGWRICLGGPKYSEFEVERGPAIPGASARRSPTTIG